MGNSNKSSQQFDGDDQDTEEWQYEDDWKDDWQDDSIHARKEHQAHRGRGKGHVRRNIEYFKEQQQLKALLDEDFDN